MLAWAVSVAIITALSVYLVINDGVASLVAMGPITALFGTAPAWWRLAVEGLGGSSSSDLPNVRPESAQTDAAEREHSGRRPGTAEFRELLAALAVAIDDPPDIYALAERTMKRPHLIHRGGGPSDALVHWQRVVQRAWQEDEDEAVLNEALALSNSPRLRTAVERWLNGM
jgi:hypothetical protein